MKNIYLKSIRIARGATQAACAKATNVSEAGFNRVENGKTTLSPKGWAQLAKFLAVPVEQLTDKQLASDHSRIVNAILRASGIDKPKVTKGAPKAKCRASDFCLKPKAFFTK